MRRAVTWTGAALLAKTVGQLLLTMAVVTRLTPNDAGLWFLFTSLGSLVQFLDLGLSTGILRSASHLYAGLGEIRERGVGELTSTQPNVEGLKKLSATVSGIYGLMAVAVVALGAVASVTVMAPLLKSAEAVGAWQLFCVAAALQLMVSQRYNFLQGIGGLVQAQKLMAMGSVLSFGASAAAIALTGSLVDGCLIFLISWGGQLVFFGNALKQMEGGKFDGALLKALWPNSWRAGLSRLSLALIYHTPTLIIGRTLGLAVAGQYGFTMQVCLFMLALVQLPITAVLPQINQLAAQGSLEELKGLFIRKMRQATGLYIVFYALLLAVGPFALVLIHAKTTLLPYQFLIPIVVFLFFENHRNNHVTIVGAFNHFPFWKYDIISGVAVMLGGIWVLTQWGLGGFIAWLWIVQSCWNFWWPVLQGLKHLGCQWKEYYKGMVGC